MNIRQITGWAVRAVAIPCWVIGRVCVLFAILAAGAEIYHSLQARTWEHVTLGELSVLLDMQSASLMGMAVFTTVMSMPAWVVFFVPGIALVLLHRFSSYVAKHLIDSSKERYGGIELDGSWAVYFVNHVIGQVVAVLLCLSGLIITAFGLSGSIDWIIESGSLKAKIINASPGISFLIIGAVIMWRYKSRFTTQETIRSHSPDRGYHERTVIADAGLLASSRK